MTDKLRHRTLRAPQGYLPNWALMVIAACAMMVVGFANMIV